MHLNMRDERRLANGCRDGQPRVHKPLRVTWEGQHGKRSIDGNAKSEERERNQW